MKRKVIKTADGSTTIFLEDWNEHYHSKHGAIQEATHVFIKHGLHIVQHNTINILEIGFGTGLNAFITFLESKRLNKSINYVGVEAYPVAASEVQKLNYVDALNAKLYEKEFSNMHEEQWEIPIEISENFVLEKRKQRFEEINDVSVFDLIFFDAFGARVQPELWSEAMFDRMFNALKSGGILVTYAAKGSVRRAMLEVGFQVEKLPGPPGKREMLRAIKPK
ncbi:tRNA (5-methylaminomethyl-2-thiouridine)(34)-methyltransferase MnmD [Urechidicola sp. KH5]